MSSSIVFSQKIYTRWLNKDTTIIVSALYFTNGIHSDGFLSFKGGTIDTSLFYKSSTRKFSNVLNSDFPTTSRIHGMTSSKNKSFYITNSFISPLLTGFYVDSAGVYERYGEHNVLIFEPDRPSLASRPNYMVEENKVYFNLTDNKFFHYFFDVDTKKFSGFKKSLGGSGSVNPYVSNDKKNIWDKSLDSIVCLSPDSIVRLKIKITDPSLRYNGTRIVRVIISSLGDTLLGFDSTYSNNISFRNKLYKLQNGNLIPAEQINDIFSTVTINLIIGISIDWGNNIWFTSGLNVYRWSLKSNEVIVFSRSAFKDLDTTSAPGRFSHVCVDSTNTKFVCYVAKGFWEINDIVPKISVPDTIIRLCNNKPLQFTDSSTTIGDGLYRWKWYFGDGDSSTLQNPSHQYLQPGPYTVRLWVKDSNTSRNETTLKIIVLPDPVVQLTASTDTLKVCKAELLTASSNFWSNPSWKTPDGTVVGPQSFLATKTGWYTITNTVENCISKDSVFVRLDPLVLNLGLGDTVQSCKTIQLQPEGNYLNAPQWQTPNGNINGQTKITASLTGKYLVENTYKNCQIKDSVYLIFRNPYIISLVNLPDTIFTCKSVLLAPFSLTYFLTRWQIPGSVLVNSKDIQARVSGFYKVTNDTGNCKNSDSIYVKFQEPGASDFELRTLAEELIGSNLLVVENQFPLSIIGSTQQQAASYQWFKNGDLQTGNKANQPFSIFEAGTYTIRLQTTAVDSCQNRAEKTFTINLAGAIRIPNLVTGNADGNNDRFEINQLPFYADNEISIYNRWGKEVHKAKPYQNDWPPVDLEPGTYFYRLQAGGKSFNGWVQVVR